MNKVYTLGEFVIQNQKDFPYASGELSRLLSAVRLAAKVVNSQINKAGLLDDILGYADATNVQGEEQKKLDVYTNRLFIQSLVARNEVCGIASEEEEDFIALTTQEGKNASYVVLMDPLDGSSNIDVNVSVGTIFAIYRRRSKVGEPATLDDFLQPGSEQVAAGYVIFGSSTMMVFTTGNGVHGFTFDPSVGVFYLSHEKMQIPQTGNIYSVNEGNYSHFPQGIKQYIKYCQKSDASPLHPYSARYIGSLVADFHRNLIKGGIYLYPSTERAPKGKLRLLYECNPLAFLVEQAGGKATDGYRRILDIQPDELHQRVPFYIGSTAMVDQVGSFLQEFPD